MRIRQLHAFMLAVLVPICTVATPVTCTVSGVLDRSNFDDSPLLRFTFLPFGTTLTGRFATSVLNGYELALARALGEVS